MPAFAETQAVAIAVSDPSSFEGDVVRGALAFNETRDAWRFVGTRHLPFAAFDDIDLTAIDGLIAGFYEARWVEAVRQHALPAVNIAQVIDAPKLPTVTNDDVQTGRLAAEHLFERGVARFAFVSQGQTAYSRLRLAGFRKRIAETNREPCAVFESTWEKVEADQAELAAWLHGLPKPVGIMAANDFLGRRCINTAWQLGLSVPDNVAVIGVDNDPWSFAAARTPLTTIALDFRRVGYEAAVLLDTLMAGEPSPLSRLIPPAGVVERRSTAQHDVGDELVTRTLRAFRDRCHEPITIEDVLGDLGVSRRTLENRMKATIGRTPHDALTRARVERAKRLIRRSRLSLGEIAHDCGFREQARLNEAFARVAGMSPGQFREQTRRV